MLDLAAILCAAVVIAFALRGVVAFMDDRRVWREERAEKKKNDG